MLVKLGENDVKTLEDLAGCATDDLAGWTERKAGESVKHDGFLDGLDVSREDAEAMIMRARVAAGWIDEAAPAEEAGGSGRGIGLSRGEQRSTAEPDGETDATRKARNAPASSRGARAIPPA